jgi:transposase-like protein
MKDLTNLRLSDLLKEVKITEEEIWGDLKIEAKMHLKNIIEKCLAEEQTKILRAHRSQRNMIRVDYRNGYYTRNLETTLGTIEKLTVPRNRLTKLESKVFKKYQRKEVSLKNLIKDCFLAGISTRRVGEVLEDVVGHKISAQTVSNIAKDLDWMVKKYHTRKIDDSYRFLFFDAINLRVKNLSNNNKKTVLVAYGITPKGTKEIIDFMIAKAESELSWYMFIDNLYRRGLKGKNLDLATIDGNRALKVALSTVYPFTPVQRCWVHKLRNIASKLPKKAYASCLDEAKLIYAAGSKKEAAARYRKWVAKYGAVYPKAVECLAKDIDSMLIFFDYPKEIWKKIRTTNIIERCFREVRRRVRPMTCFENDASCSRIIFGVINHLNNNWKDKPLKVFTQKT